MFNSYSDFKEWFATSPIRTLHEVIRGTQPQKLKFDIDVPAHALDALDDMEEPIPPPPHADSDLYYDHETLLDYWKSASPRTRKARRLFSIIMGAITECFKEIYSIELSEFDFAMSDSTDATKFSRHVVISEYCVENNDEAKVLYEPCAGSFA